MLEHSAAKVARCVLRGLGEDDLAWLPGAVRITTMGYFYVDESIHERAGFILGAYVFSPHELTPEDLSEVRLAGSTRQ